jgi:thiol-disulfide isomerase/thioredoxin
MKLSKLYSLIIILVAVHSLSSAEENMPFFTGTVEAAREKAKKENKLYFIEFYAKWCEPCKWMDEHTFTHPNLTSYVAKNYIPVKVDVENLDGFVWKQKYKVQYLPTIIVLNADGAVLGKYEKSMEAKDLLRILQNHKGSPVSAETEYMAMENLVPAAPVKTNQSSEAKPVFVTLKREPGLPKSSDVVRKSEETRKPMNAHSAATLTNVKPSKPEANTSDPLSDGNEYRVQVGVYSDALNATNEVSKLKKDFSQVVQVFNKKNIETNVVIYRVTIGKFNTKGEALVFVNQLKVKGIQGVIKQTKELK